MPRALLSQIYARTGDPERGADIARKGRQEFAQQGARVYIGYLLAMEATAWITAGEFAAARQPAIQAVEIAREFRNPALSALACYAAAHAVRLEEPETALKFVEDSLALTRAGAADSILGFALSLAAAIRTRNGDLRGALTVLYEATVQQHGDGNRLGLGITLERAAVVFSRLGEAESAAVLAGAVFAHFAVTTANVPEEERAAIDQAYALARRGLAEDVHDAALARGASMSDDEVAEYALIELRRLLDGAVVG
jgi:ATP/maltotriose-dependent transcriptional regulator MalT